MTPRCDRPGCERRATHSPLFSGDTITGWSALCCEHTDELMLIHAPRACSDPIVALLGRRSWIVEHARSCGPRQPARPID